MPRLGAGEIIELAKETHRADLTPFTVEELEQEGLRRVALATETPIAVGDIINELRDRHPERIVNDIYEAVGVSRRNGHRWSKLRREYAA